MPRRRTAPSGLQEPRVVPSVPRRPPRQDVHGRGGTEAMAVVVMMGGRVCVKVTPGFPMVRPRRDVGPVTDIKNRSLNIPVSAS